MRNIGEILKSYTAFSTSFVAGATGDNTLVTGGNIEAAGLDSGKLIVTGKVSLASGKKITANVVLQHSDNGSDWDSITIADSVVWRLAAGAADVNHLLTPIEYDFDRANLKKYIRSLGTFDLDASGTDTAVVSGAFVMSGGWENPVSRA